jgi:hypothetical protein
MVSYNPQLQNNAAKEKVETTRDYQQRFRMVEAST